MSDIIWMSIKDYAKYKGVAYQTIHDTLGVLIPKEAFKKKGKHVIINRDVADQYYIPKQKIAFSQKEVISEDADEHKEVLAKSETNKKPSSDKKISDYQNATIEEKMWKAKKVELDVRLKQGEYYRKIEVDNYIKSAIIATKDQITMLPDKISDYLNLTSIQKKHIAELCEDTLMSLVKLKDRL